LDKSAFKDRAKTISLAPAYPQLSFYEDGSDNLVTLNLGYSEPEGLHYYALSSKEATLQDLNLKLQIPLPDDFNGWQAEPIVVNYKTANLDLNANQLNIQLFDSAKNNVSLNNNTQLVSQTWKRQVITLASSGVFDPSSVINLDLQIASNQNGKVNLGVIELNYYGK
jgi:hypothetical protein